MAKPKKYNVNISIEMPMTFTQLNRLEKISIEYVLNATGGDVTKSAKILGGAYRVLYQKMVKHSIKIKDFRENGKLKRGPKKDNTNTLSNLKIYRIKAKLTQGQLADKLGLKRGTVAHYECGITKPSFKRLVAMSKLFKVPVDNLITGL